MRSILTTILFMAFSALCAGPAHATRQPDRPNIIFILADDLGYADVGCYGATKIKTPHIDRIAKEGILFTDGHAGASTCTPTRYGFMTGQHAWRSWCTYSALSSTAPLLIEEDRVTVASFLKSAGYATSIIGKWHLGYGKEEGFADNRGDAPSNYWEARGSGPDWNGVLTPGPRENGFDYSYVIPVANSFPPYVMVENYRVAGLRKDSPIGKLQSRNFGSMEGGVGARWKDGELIDKFVDKLIWQLEDFAKRKTPLPKKTNRRSSLKESPMTAKKEEPQEAKVEITKEDEAKLKAAAEKKEDLPKPKRTKGRGYWAGVVVREYGVDVVSQGITDEMIAKVDELTGKPSPQQSAAWLRDSLMLLAGYCNAWDGIEEEKDSA